MARSEDHYITRNFSGGEVSTRLFQKLLERLSLLIELDGPGHLEAELFFALGKTRELVLEALAFGLQSADLFTLRALGGLDLEHLTPHGFELLLDGLGSEHREISARNGFLESPRLVCQLRLREIVESLPHTVPPGAHFLQNGLDLWCVHTRHCEPPRFE